MNFFKKIIETSKITYKKTNLNILNAIFLIYTVEFIFILLNIDNTIGIKEYIIAIFVICIRKYVITFDDNKKETC